MKDLNILVTSKLFNINIIKELSCTYCKDNLYWFMYELCNNLYFDTSIFTKYRVILLSYRNYKDNERP